VLNTHNQLTKFYNPHHLCNGEHAGLECGTSWVRDTCRVRVRATVGSGLETLVGSGLEPLVGSGLETLVGSGLETLVGSGLEPLSGQIKDYKFCISCFTVQYAASKSKRLVSSESR
jgi:hypothetical protein